MNYLYRITRTEKRLSVDELLCQCMRLEQSFREKFLDVISRTAVTLLKVNAVFGSGRTNPHELNALKTMYVAIDCIDLTMNAYEPDYDEVIHELNTESTNKNLPKSSSTIGECPRLTPPSYGFDSDSRVSRYAYKCSGRVFGGFFDIIFVVPGRPK